MDCYGAWWPIQSTNQPINDDVMTPAWCDAPPALRSTTVPSTTSGTGGGSYLFRRKFCLYKNLLAATTLVLHVASDDRAQVWATCPCSPGSSGAFCLFLPATMGITMQACP